MAMTSAAMAVGQGVSTRSVTPAPRARASGRPWPVRFQDVAAQAGLKAPIVYGGVNQKSYILEATGCGAAFLDFDNDGSYGPKIRSA